MKTLPHRPGPLPDGRAQTRAWQPLRLRQRYRPGPCPWERLQPRPDTSRCIATGAADTNRRRTIPSCSGGSVPEAGLWKSSPPSPCFNRRASVATHHQDAVFP